MKKPMARKTPLGQDPIVKTIVNHLSLFISPNLMNMQQKQYSDPS